MRKLLFAAVLFAAPASALAQVHVAVNLGWTAPPPVVEVSPGVQVVQDYDEEVFFTNGRYWVERGGAWYWTQDYRGHWIPAGPQPVPLFLRNHHRGQYRHWKHVERRHAVRIERAEHHEAVRRAEVRHERREERREERHRH